MDTPRTTGAVVYDRRTLWFHWLTVLLVAGQWLGAHAIDLFPRGPLRVDARATHIVFGVLLGVLILARLLWRRSGGVRLPATDTGALKAAASLAHGALYVLLLTTVALGLANTWIRGDSLFGLVTLPKMVGAAPALKEQVQELHELSANAILAVTAMHASAALWHQYWRRDGLLGRMIPALRGTGREHG